MNHCLEYTKLISIIFFIYLIILIYYSKYNNNLHKYTINQIGGRKYIGITNNPSTRISKHFEGNGAKWTQKYRPINVQELNYVGSKKNAKIVEREKYYEYKNIYGIDKVRGAGYTSSIE